MSSTDTATFLHPDQEVLGARGSVLVEFWAPWCGPCVAFKPIVERVAGPRGLTTAFVDVQDLPELAERFGIHSIPSLRLFPRRRARRRAHRLDERDRPRPVAREARGVSAETAPGAQAGAPRAHREARTRRERSPPANHTNPAIDGGRNGGTAVRSSGDLVASLLSGYGTSARER